MVENLNHTQSEARILNRLNNPKHLEFYGDKMSKVSKKVKIVELLGLFIDKSLSLDLDVKMLFSGIEIGTLKIKGTIKIGEEKD